MRLDHYHKNIIVIAGMIAFFKLNNTIINVHLLAKLVTATLIVCIAASFNYIINEIMDRKTDKFHSRKKYRPIPSGDVNIYVLLIIGGCILLVTLFFSYHFYSTSFFVTLILFFLFAILYNVPPFRFKDIAYLDVITESANSPFRFLLGWFAAGSNLFPQISILMPIWCLGGFLMSAKRYSEYGFISNDNDRFGYRKSYKVYTREKLSTFMVLWLIIFSFSFAIFIIRVEPATLVTFPFLTIFFAWYWWLSHKSDSVVKEPERIFEEKRFFVYSIFLLIFFSVVFLFGNDIPFLKDIHYRYIFPK